LLKISNRLIVVTRLKKAHRRRAQWEYGCRREAARTAFPFAENTAEKHRILSDRHGKRPTGSVSNRIVLTGCMATLRVHFMRGSVEAAFFDPLERLNGEIKRRSDVVGIFPTKMPLRLVGASCSNRTANGPFSAADASVRKQLRL